MDIFSVFTQEPYTFIAVEPVSSGGYKVVQEFEALGVIKHRDGKVLNGHDESFDTQTTLHIHPTEGFIEFVGGSDRIVGNYIKINNVDYQINACTEGKNFDTGIVEHYRLTLERASLWQSSLPLK